MSAHPVRVGFVLLAWNRAELEARCLASIQAQSDPNWQLVVVDNGSCPPFALPSDARSDGRIHLLRSERNLGYAAGMNLGLASCDAEFLVPVNGDVLLREDYVSVLRTLHQRCCREHIASLAPMVLRGTREEPQGLESKGWYLRGRFSVLTDENVLDGAEVFSASGACAAYLAKAARQVELEGGDLFDSSYFAYGEDLDLHFRLHYAGWQCVYVQSLVAWHRTSAYSTGMGSALDADPFLQACILANRLRNIIKYLSLRDLIWFGPPILATEVAMLLSSLVLERPRFGAYRKAYAAIWRDRRKLLRQRGDAQRSRRMSSCGLLRLTRGI